MTRALVFALLLLPGLARPAQAQIRGFADVGATSFTASESFDAVLGTSSGVVFGGGVEVALPRGIFANLRASQFKADGQRVFIFEGERFELGVPTTVTVVPILLTGGYRFTRWPRLAPYGGAGIGWHRYKETSEFAADDEDVNEQFTGFHVLGGAEFRLASLVAAAGEVEWATVPDALGTDPNSVSAAFDEHDLGGVTLRVKVIIGR